MNNNNKKILLIEELNYYDMTVRPLDYFDRNLDYKIIPVLVKSHLNEKIAIFILVMVNYFCY